MEQPVQCVVIFTLISDVLSSRLFISLSLYGVGHANSVEKLKPKVDCERVSTDILLPRKCVIARTIQ